jgi:hypothetical protein
VAPSAYLSICAIYRDEAPYIAEWIEFHKLVGVERFFLFNNLSSDGHREALAPYVEEGTVIVEDWPGERRDFPAQAKCNFHCVEQHRHETRWLAFIDLDEFLFCPTGRPVPELLPEFEYASALWVTRPMFGASGHRTKPPGLVTENYTRRGDGGVPAFTMKRITNPERIIAPGVHMGAYSEGPLVNEEHEVLPKPTGPPVFSKLRLNHYFTKSEEEARVKANRLRPSDGKPQVALQRKLDTVLEMLDRVTDTTIQMYLPALRKALAERQRAAAEAKS